MTTPVPVTVLQSSELDNMAPGSIYEALTQMPMFWANSRPGGGGRLSSGANLNLRGAGINRTLVLLDGRRMVPSNRFGAVDVDVIPESLLSSVETVTGGASASYGADAVAGVVNFILDTDFQGFELRGQAGETVHGDGENYEAAIAFGTPVGRKGHFIASAETYKIDTVEGIDSLRDRGFYQQRAWVTNPDYTPDLANGPALITRNFVASTSWNDTGMIIQPGSSLDRLVFNPDGTVSPLDFSGVGAVNGGCNCQAQSTQTYDGVGANSTVTPGYERTSLFLRYDYDVADNVTVFAQGLFAGNEDRNPVQDGLTLNLVWAPRIYADNAFLPESVRQIMLQPGEAEVVPGSEGVPSVGFSFFGGGNNPRSFGHTRQDNKNELYSGTLGVQVEFESGLFEGWHLDSYVQSGENELSYDIYNGIRVDRVPLAIDAVVDPATGNIVCHVALVDPENFGDCVPINLFGGVDSISDEGMAYILDQKHTIQTTSQDVFEFVMSGKVGDGFGAGPVEGAFGASYRSEKLSQGTPDPTDEYPATRSGVLLSDLGLLPPGQQLIPQHLPDGIPGVRNVPPGYSASAGSSSVAFSSLSEIHGDYSVKEVFGELNVPIYEGSDGVTRFDSNAAVRWADYEGSGGIWAYKLGLSWQVNEAVRLRLTQSRDVRAATLRERFDQTVSAVLIRDPENVDPVTGGPLTVSAIRVSGGNVNVNPEEADSTTFGVVVQPLDSLSMSIDWFLIDIGEAIAQLSPQALVDQCSAGDDSLCQYVYRDQDNMLTRVDDLFINFSNQTIEGVDIEIAYGFGMFDWRLFASRLLENSLQNPGSPKDDLAGEIGSGRFPTGLPETKVTTNLDYSNGPFSAFAQIRYISGGKLNRFFVEGVDIDENDVPSTVYADIGARYRFGSEDQFELFGNVNNIFDQDPRATPSSLGRNGVSEFDPSQYDVLGRRFVIGVNWTL